MTDVLSAAAGAALLVTPAVTLPAALRVHGRAPFAVAALVAAAASVVAVFIALSLADLLTRGWILLGQFGVAGAALAAWHLVGRPAPPRGYVSALRTGLGAARGHPAVAALTLLVAVALALQLFMAVAVAPNNWDSMTYHLSRAAYWLQNHSATQFFPGTIRQNGAPPNAEMLQAWTMAVTGTDRFAQLVQWLALLGLAAAIFSGARLLGFARPAALFAAGLFVAMPQPIMQATSTQNDLVVSFFVAAGALFGVRGLRDRSRGDLVVAATALGLAIGTKGTAAIAAPSVGLLLVAAVWRYRPSRATVVTAAALVVAGVGVLGIFNYALNVKNTDSLLGGAGPRAESRERVAGSLTGGVPRPAEPFPDTLLHEAWAFADTTGMTVGWLQLAVRRPMQAVFGHSFGFDIDKSVSEDTSAFGPLGFLLFLPVLLFTALRLRAPPAHRIVALAALLYLVVFALTTGWNNWIGRVLIPMVALGAPMLAALYSRGWTRALALGLAVLGLVPSVVLNDRKRLLVAEGDSTILAGDRIAQQTIYRPDLASLYRAIEHRFPGKPIGFVGGEDAWDYPLFGEHRDRRVERLTSQQAQDDGLVRRKGLVAIVWGEIGRPPRRLTAELPVAELSSGYYLIQIRG